MENDRIIPFPTKDEFNEKMSQLVDNYIYLMIEYAKMTYGEEFYNDPKSEDAIFEFSMLFGKCLSKAIDNMEVEDL